MSQLIKLVWRVWVVPKYMILMYNRLYGDGACRFICSQPANFLHIGTDLQSGMPILTRISL